MEIESTQTLLNKSNIEGLRQNQTILNDKNKALLESNSLLQTTVNQMQQQIQQIQQSNAIFQAQFRGNGSTTV